MADIITTIANAIAIAAATLPTRLRPIVCPVPEGCEVQHMTTNPEAKGGPQKCNTSGSHVWRFGPNCHGGSTAWHAVAVPIALGCGSAATGRKKQTMVPGPVLKSARGLLTRDFHVAISDTIGIGRSAVRFVTLRLEQTSGSPFVAWHAKRRPRLFSI
ncbi:MULTISPECIES: hypothetical protein [Bradyrhizobium]|uniref:hypothetical protein n=1 Tax=Bradyrhizobium TaxID=374 RepID=UPI0013DF5914|nr:MULTISPECIES: hypothetical protein [Bradyrhizobium]